MNWLKMMVLAGVASLLVLGGSGYASAQGQQQQKPKATPQQRFDELDANKDGKVSLDEQKKSLTKRHDLAEKKFKKIDKNSDGTISKDEFVGPVKKQMENVDKKFKAKDKNGDGYLSQEEFLGK